MREVLFEKDQRIAELTLKKEQPTEPVVENAYESSVTPVPPSQTDVEMQTDERNWDDDASSISQSSNRSSNADLDYEIHRLRRKLKRAWATLDDFKIENEELRNELSYLEDRSATLSHNDQSDLQQEIAELRQVVETSEELVTALEADLEQARREGHVMQQRLLEYENILKVEN